MTQPDPTTKGARIGQAFARRKGRIIVGAALTGVLILGGGGVVYAVTQNQGGDYRTAIAAKGSVDETLALTGSIEAATDKDAAFQVAGTVDGVSVKLGDTVTAGQTLATLDTDDLQDALDSANQSVSDAEEKLADDLDSQSSGTSSTSSTGSGSTNSGSGSGGSSADGSGSGSGGSGAGAAGGSSTGGASGGSSAGGSSTDDGTSSGSSSADSAAVTKALAAVTTAQNALLAQYDVSSTALDASTQAVTDSKTICAPFLAAAVSGDDADDAASASAQLQSLDADADGTDSSGTDSSGTDASGTDAGDSASSGTGTGDSSTSAPTTAELQAMLEDCQSAIDAAVTAAGTTQTEQSTLQDRASDLDDAVAALQTALAASTSDADTTATRSSTGSAALMVTAAFATTTAAGTTNTTTTGTGTTATPAADVSGGASAQGSSATVTAAQILADRAAIASAESEAAIAENDLSFATLTSPVDGTVVDVALAEGDSVSAGSTTAVITVDGGDGYVVSSTVSLAKIAKVAVGQKTTVVLPSSGTTVTGEVSSVGVLDVSETSTPSYTVTVAIGSDEKLLLGASAQLSVALTAAADVLTVPTSAVHTSGSTTSVDVLVDGEPVTTTVEIGAMGSEATQITSGLKAGDVVVLADLDQAMDTDSDTTESTGLSGLGGSSTSNDQPGAGGGFGGPPSGNAP